MAGFFYNLGKKTGPKLRKGKWVWQSLVGTQEEIAEAEYKVGLDLAEELRRQVAISGDAGKCEMVEGIGRMLAGWVAKKHSRFNFEVIEQGRANAFALPGGFIFVTESLLELCGEDADAAAFVLAHEMAHVIRGHAIDRLITSSAINIVSRTPATVGAVGAWLKRVGVEFLESAYSQDNETEADELGARLTAAAGYDVDGAVRLFKRLSELEDQNKRSILSEYFSTHPALAVRIKNIKGTSK